MKKLCALSLAITCLASLVGCRASDAVDESDICGKTYVYENEGFGGDFTIEIKDDGTFTYYEGMLSSYIGSGNWTFADGMLTLAESVPVINSESGEAGTSTRTQQFSVERDALRFKEAGSDNFIYLKVKDGEKFQKAGE